MSSVPMQAASPQLPEDVRQALIRDCRASMPNQACGLILFDATGVARAVHPTPNHGAWPYGFQISPQAQLRAFRRAREQGLRIGGVYHCHLASEAVPTGRDLKRPVPPGFAYVIVSLLHPERPSVRTWLFEDGVPVEVDIPPSAARTAAPTTPGSPAGPASPAPNLAAPSRTLQGMPS